MISEIAKKLLEETPPEVRARVREYGDIVATELTDEEWRAAIFEAKLKKWFHNRNRAYWESQPGAYEGDKDMSDALFWLTKADRFRMGKSRVYITNMGGREVFIESRQQMDDSFKWIVKMDSWVLGRDDKFHYEPMPSSRTYKFIKLTRFNDYIEAYEYWCKHEENHSSLSQPVLTC